MSLALALNPLDGAAELDIHVAVDADEAAGVLGLAPLEADADVVVDERLQHGPRVHGDELCEGERGVSAMVLKYGCGLGIEGLGTYAHGCGLL